MLCQENYRFICRSDDDPIVAVAAHDKLYWIIVSGIHLRWQSARGYEIGKAALQSMSKILSDVVWQKAEDRYLELSK